MTVSPTARHHRCRRRGAARKARLSCELAMWAMSQRCWGHDAHDSVFSRQSQVSPGIVSRVFNPSPPGLERLPLAPARPGSALEGRSLTARPSIREMLIISFTQSSRNSNQGVYTDVLRLPKVPGHLTVGGKINRNAYGKSILYRWQCAWQKRPRRAYSCDTAVLENFPSSRHRASSRS